MSTCLHWKGQTFTITSAMASTSTWTMAFRDCPLQQLCRFAVWFLRIFPLTKSYTSIREDSQIDFAAGTLFACFFLGRGGILLISNFSNNRFLQALEKPYHRVATDLENLEKSGNLKETSESQGICQKSQGICDRIPKVRELCCLKFTFSQAEDPNFENFLGEYALRPP